MHITIAPAGTKTAAATIRSLLDGPSQHDIRAVYRDLAKVPAEFASNARLQAVRGDVGDAESLDFSGSDAVLTITPPTLDNADVVAEAERVSKNVRDAVERAGSVRRLVLLSSGGAQFTEGTGLIKANNRAETVLASTKIPDVVFVRCTYFVENWAATLDTLKAPEPFIFSTITPGDWRVPMVAVNDIGAELAAEVSKETASPSKPYVFELHGPDAYTAKDVREAFSQALGGKPVGLRLVPKNELHGFYAQAFPADTVPDWVEMTACFLPGGVLAPDQAERDGAEIRRGRIGLDEGIKALVEPGLGA